MKTLVSTVLIIAIVIVLIWWIVRWTTQSSTTILSGPLCVDGATQCPSGYTRHGKRHMANNKLNPNPSSNNYTISLWYYVSNWTQTPNPKVLFTRLNAGSGSKGSPSIALGHLDNNLEVSVACHSGSQQGAASHTPASGAIDCDLNKHPSGLSYTQCFVDNVPVQRWVNVLVSVYGRTLDVYVDGKLAKTCLLPGLAIASAAGWCIVAPGNQKQRTAPVHKITADTQHHEGDASAGSTHCPVPAHPGHHHDSHHAKMNECEQKQKEAWDSFSSSGFVGYVDQVRYWGDATNPQQAYNIYKDGPSGGSWGTNFFNDYYMEVGFYDKGKDEFSFRI